VAGHISGIITGVDRAFVFDPLSSISDSSFAKGLSDLLAGSPAAGCLKEQINTIAARNSCRGPWSISSWATLNIPAAALHLRSVGRVSLTALVPTSSVGAISDVIRPDRWSAYTAVDNVLLTVRSFDKETGQYRYTVNPAFGRPRQQRPRLSLVLNVSIPLSASPGRQALTKSFRASPNELTKESIRDDLLASVPFNPVEGVIAVQESLALTASQKVNLQHVAQVFQSQRDSVVDALWRTIRTSSNDQSERLKVLQSGQSEMFDKLEALSSDLRTLLTSEQLALLPRELQQLLDPRSLRLLRHAVTRR
jgi:hypothetical protein